MYNNECVGNEISHLEAENSDTKEIKLDTWEKYVEGEALWNMNFDGSISKDAVGADVFIVNSSTNIAKAHGYKLNFQCTNNII